MSIASDSAPALAREATQRRKQARQQRWAASRVRRVARRVLVVLTILFSLIAAWGGTSQAAPWNVADNAMSTVQNFCGPENIKASTFSGPDNSILTRTQRQQQDWDKRGTYIPHGELAPGTPGNGLQRLQKAYSDAPKEVQSPEYVRYGLMTLQWQNYGSSCFSTDYYTGTLSNTMYSILVKTPMMLAMMGLHLALDNVIYDGFSLLITPFVQVTAELFRPWMMLLATAGVVVYLLKSRANLGKVLQACTWVVCIVGTYFWMSQHSSSLERYATNIVTNFSAQASCQLSQASNSNQGVSCGPNESSLAVVDNALWRGVPYQTWQIGQVGQQQAETDRALEARGQMGWSQAILNGQYLGTRPTENGPELDPAGQHLSGKINEWNNRSYHQADSDAKSNAWTTGNGDNAWRSVPFLLNVKYMCNDKAAGNESSGDEEYNQWLYGGQCDAQGAGTSAWVNNFKGNNFDTQFVATFMGCWAALAVLLTVGGSSMYLVFYKLAFNLLLLVFPIFLAIGASPVERTRAFARKYGERLLSNVAKQVVATWTVLFVCYAMSMLLAPPPGTAIDVVPWGMKPFIAIAFFIALVVFALPTARIVKAAAKGDANVVDRTADMPKKVVKKSTKLAATAAVAAATGGTTLGKAALASGKTTEFLRSMSRMGMGSSKNGVGKALFQGVQMADGARRMRDVRSMAQGNRAAQQQGAEMLAQRNPGQYPRDAQGNLTPDSRAAAVKQFDNLAQQGGAKARADKAYESHMAQFYEGYRNQNAGVHHPLDPSSPQNQQIAAVERESKNAAVREQVKQERARSANQQAWGDAAMARIDSPGWAADRDLKANNTVASGSQILEGLNMNRTEAAANLPRLMDAYDRNTAVMDPRHASTPALMNMQWAMEHGSDEDKHNAVFNAAESVYTHGAPNRIDALVSTGASKRTFEPTSLVATMPSVTADTPWQDRVESAKVFSAAAANVPEGHSLLPDVTAMRTALTDPTADADRVNELQAQLIHKVDDLDPASAAQRRMSHTPDPDGVSEASQASWREYGNRVAAPVDTQWVEQRPAGGDGDEVPYAGSDATFNYRPTGTTWQGELPAEPPMSSRRSTPPPPRDADGPEWASDAHNGDGPVHDEDDLPAVERGGADSPLDGQWHGQQRRIDSGLFDDDDEDGAEEDDQGGQN